MLQHALSSTITRQSSYVCADHQTLCNFVLLTTYSFYFINVARIRFCNFGNSLRLYRIDCACNTLAISWEYKSIASPLNNGSFPCITREALYLSLSARVKCSSIDGTHRPSHRYRSSLCSNVLATLKFSLLNQTYSNVMVQLFLRLDCLSHDKLQ